MTTKTRQPLPKTAFGTVVLSATLLCLSACATPDTVSDQPNAEDVAGALMAYSAGWAERNTDAILERHADETAFEMVVYGAEPARGKEAARAAFDAIFDSNPNYQSTVRRVRFGDDFAVVEYDIHVDPDRTAYVGGTAFTPSGQSYLAPAVDIIVFKDGLVTLKTTYLDTETIRANSAKVERVK